MSNKKKIAVFLSGLDEEYQNQITQGIHEFAAAHNIDVLHFIAFGGILNNGSYDTGEYNIFRLPNLQELDGVILLTNTIDSPETVREIISQVRASGVPAVSVDADYQDFFSICVDNHSAMAQIVRHFTNEHGLRRINYVSGPDDNPDSIARLAAYKQVLEEHNIPIEEARIYHGTFQRRDGRTAVDVFLRSDLPMPEAIVCANDTMAVSVIGALNARGIRVPGDIMVSGLTIPTTPGIMRRRSALWQGPWDSAAPLHANCCITPGMAFRRPVYTNWKCSHALRKAAAVVPITVIPSGISKSTTTRSRRISTLTSLC